MADGRMIVSFVVLIVGIARSIVTGGFFVGDELLGILEALLETGLKGLVDLVTRGLLLVLLFGLEGGLPGCLPLRLGGLDELCLLLVEGVDLVHGGSVDERVLLGLVVETDDVLDVLKLVLDGIGVDDGGEVSASHDGPVERVAALLLGGLVEVAEDAVELLEGGLGEDHETAEMTAGGELQDVEAVDIADVDAHDVAGSLGEVLIIVVVDDEGTLGPDVAGVSVLALTSAHGLGLLDLGELGANTEGLEEFEEFLGLAIGERNVDDERELSNLLDSVASGHDQRGAGRGGESRSDGVSAHRQVAFGVPLPPDLEGSEHAGLTAHVTEGGLARAGGTGAADSGNTSDGAASTPGLGGVFSAGLVEDSVTLSAVLSKLGVHEVDKIVSDGDGHASGQGGITSTLGGAGVGFPHSDGRSRSHNKIIINATIFQL